MLVDEVAFTLDRMLKPRVRGNCNEVGLEGLVSKIQAMLDSSPPVRHCPVATYFLLCGRCNS